MKGTDGSLKERVFFWPEAIYCKPLLMMNRSMKKLKAVGIPSVILLLYELLLFF